MKKLCLCLILCLFSTLMISGCVEEITRDEAIPDDAIKYTPEMDLFTPVVHSTEWAQPVPMPGPINTAGAEDACFITPDGNTFLFFFTPDVRVPPNEQLLDGVTGVWWCQRQGNSWTEPTRILLSKNLALDGAPFYQDNILWFASFRVGNYRDDGDMWTARYENGKWVDIKNAGELLNDVYNIGEMHLSSDGKTMYFHRLRAEGATDYDLFTTTLVGGTWTEPVNIGPPVSTEKDDSRPFLSSDGTELWFTRESNLGYTGPAVYRSIKNPDGSWGEPVEIASNFAGEPTLDDAGNLYFVHHFFDEQMNMVEADIYVCYKQ
jgi:hypothetical protein